MIRLLNRHSSNYWETYFWMDLDFSNSIDFERDEECYFWSVAGLPGTNREPFFIILEKKTVR